MRYTSTQKMQCTDMDFREARAPLQRDWTARRDCNSLLNNNMTKESILI